MTIIVYDTFTGTGNVEAHTGETGATWALNAAYGPGASGEFVLNGSALWRSTFGTSGSLSTGTAVCYPSGVLPTGDFAIEAGVTFADTTDACSIEFWGKANQNPGKFLAGMASNLALGRAAKALAIDDPVLATGAGSTFGFAAATPYVLRLEVSGLNAILRVNGTSYVSFALSTRPLNQFGIAMYDTGVGVITVDYFKVEITTVPAFWNRFVSAVEVDS